MNTERPAAYTEAVDFLKAVRAEYDTENKAKLDHSAQLTAAALLIERTAAYPQMTAIEDVKARLDDGEATLIEFLDVLITAAAA